MTSIHCTFCFAIETTSPVERKTTLYSPDRRRLFPKTSLSEVNCGGPTKVAHKLSTQLMLLHLCVFEDIGIHQILTIPSFNFNRFISTLTDSAISISPSLSKELCNCIRRI